MFEPLIYLLAAAGAVALVSRLVSTLGRWLLRTAEVTVAESKAEVGARRGDLTSLAEARELARGARRARRLNAALAVLLLLTIVLPVAFGVFQVYAVAAVLWLVPGGRG